MVVSGFSRQKTVEYFDTTLAQAIDPYMKFKNIYILDRTTEEFKGLGGNSLTGALNVTLSVWHKVVLSTHSFFLFLAYIRLLQDDFRMT